MNLNNHIRSQILLDLMSRWRVTEIEQLEKEVVDVGKALLLRYAGEEQLEIWRKIGELAQRISHLAKHNERHIDFNVTFRGMSLRLNPRSLNWNAPIAAFPRLFVLREFDTFYLELDANQKADEELGERLLNLSQRIHEHQKARNNASREAEATLQKFRTFKQLGAAWPDVMPIAKKYLPDSAKPVSNLPMVQVDVLNAQFELPPEEQTETPELEAA